MLDRVIGQINNLYNAIFWALLQQGGLTHTAVEELLRGTVSSDESFFGRDLTSMIITNWRCARKWSVVFRKYSTEDFEATGNKLKGKRVEAGT
ncbi:uncharacterized protein A1O9_00914 [Exophiala aquamarina CBS 119918]|uniref:Thg1 C-terminal domain-containing protein n=1 Tax=Exophiala aquamarina CBS 119918 TaxID=1182545 RepID=A0A072Q4V2_9EURO|nr:uncharacterized protein A1O9_00914 [Exophiala aquamarina CBS 119918]KEF62940.1 hypothetical protein A1O9_00914 [Exophiala aquamarina CBS 119918]